MLLEEERNLVVKYGKKLIESGLTKGTGGNISIFNREKNLMVISPSGIDYFETKPEDVVVLNLTGEIIDGDKKPSSEYSMHQIFYERRADVNAVVHTHAVYSTTLSCLRWDLPASHYLVGFSGRNVRCAQYATFGTDDLAENAFQAMGDNNAVFLANHGQLAVGSNIAMAFNVAEEIEFCAEVHYRAKSIGEPIILPEEEMSVILEKFKWYGQK